MAENKISELKGTCPVMARAATDQKINVYRALFRSFELDAVAVLLDLLLIRWKYPLRKHFIKILSSSIAYDANICQQLTLQATIKIASLLKNIEVAAFFTWIIGLFGEDITAPFK